MTWPLLTPESVPAVTGPRHVAVNQALDIASVDQVFVALRSATTRAAAEPERRVVLDLSACDFVDAVGYRLLSQAVQTARECGVDVDVVGAGRTVVRSITLLDGLLSGDVSSHLVPPAAGAGAPVAPAASEPRVG